VVLIASLYDLDIQQAQLIAMDSRLHIDSREKTGDGRILPVAGQ
jgi:hypothetical protein